MPHSRTYLNKVEVHCEAVLTLIGWALNAYLIGVWQHKEEKNQNGDAMMKVGAWPMVGIAKYVVFGGICEAK